MVAVQRPNVTDVKGTTAVVNWEVRWWLSGVAENCFHLWCSATPFLVAVVSLSTIKFSIVLWVDHISQPELSLDI